MSQTIKLSGRALELASVADRLYREMNVDLMSLQAEYEQKAAVIQKAGMAEVQRLMDEMFDIVGIAPGQPRGLVNLEGKYRDHGDFFLMANSTEGQKVIAEAKAEFKSPPRKDLH